MFLKTYQRTNQSTCVSNVLLLRKAVGFKNRIVLLMGLASYWRESCLGKNVLVAYLPWEGYNFEDAILISERLS